MCPLKVSIEISRTGNGNGIIKKSFIGKDKLSLKCSNLQGFLLAPLDEKVMII